MFDMAVQRTLIAYLRRVAPWEYEVRRSDLRRQFATKMSAAANIASRRTVAREYHQRKAAMVISMAGYVSYHFAEESSVYRSTIHS